ncbi:rod-binding protein [Sneathiella sp.]|uniref:rod-binding protein n=1 Tax=Sneathiella sp. TaxID=1964365 RepID=UPI002FE23E48
MTDIQTVLPHIAAGPGGTSRKPDPETDAALRKTALEFEAFFLSQFLNSMSSGLDTEGMFSGGESEKMFRSMLNDEYARSMSRNNGIGIADAVYREMLAMQEV